MVTARGEEGVGMGKMSEGEWKVRAFSYGNSMSTTMKSTG